MSKELLVAMRDGGFCEYGSEVTGQWVRDTCGIYFPTKDDLVGMSVDGIKKLLNGVALQELGATDYVRNILLGEGKYFGSCSTGYRVFLPSETREQIELYMKSGDRKYRRAQKLLHNLPPLPSGSPPDNTAARLQAKMNSNRQQL
jgi:hypothetical protein